MFDNERKGFVEKRDNIIFGIRPVIEAIKSGVELEKVLLQNGLKGETFRELYHLFKEEEVPFQVVPAGKINQLTRANHQGVVAVISPIKYKDLDEILAQNKTPYLLALDRISDVRNFGAIARTAECAGVDAIIIPAKGSALINDDAIKTSAGALFNIPVCRAKSLMRTIGELKTKGIEIVGASEKATHTLQESSFKKPICLVMGSEESGICREILEQCDRILKLPMKGKIESLNVSVATGIFLFEINKHIFKEK